MVTVRCTRKGCGQEFDPAQNAPDACSFHPGAPVFHEGLKSWSCCQDTNKPVLDFDEFMKLPGCHEAAHTDEPPKTQPAAPKPAESSGNAPKMTMTSDGKESYTTAAVMPAAASAKAPAAAPAVATTAAAPAAPVEEEDDPSATVPAGTKCRHTGCSVVYESDAVHRAADGAAATCVYHPRAPIFHEGSKGYLCCKPRVLEFDEFLKIQGCKDGRHVFVPKATAAGAQEEFTECRIDHYQTPAQVHVSVFAKKADPERSSVVIEDAQLHLDLYLPAAKRFKRTLALFGPVDSGASTHKFYGTKVEVTLQKQDTRSWTVLEKTDLPPGVALTFGVSGRTGTIGSKEFVLDADNRLGRS